MVILVVITTDFVYSVDDMIKMEYAIFMCKFSNQMLPEHFCDYFTKLDNVHQYSTRQKHRNEFYQFYISTEPGKNSSSYLFKDMEKYSTGISSWFVLKFKQYYKSNTLLKYNDLDELTTVSFNP